MSAPKPTSESTIGVFLSSLASKEPTPGGGAAAALTGATAAATASMVVEYSLGKKKLEAHEESNAAARDYLRRARVKFLTLGDDDAIGYAKLNTLWKLDKDDPKRIKEWDATVEDAITPPLEIVSLGVDLMRLLEALCATTNRMLKSDLGVAAVLCDAASRSAAFNVRINLPMMPEDARTPIESELNKQLEQIHDLCAQIEERCS
ncbi:MAG: cyclodeaminase/cyclohydrolase family protein [Phycisphaerales bacterium]|nr:cyclodeaminase/cyclohydrolase family protein [Phycisphaerales bacterium]